MNVIIECGKGNPVGDTTLRSMFEDRKSVFVDLLRWDVPTIDGRFELDQFDDEHATYVVIADSCGDHLGSARLLPTTRQHILDTLFPHLCASPPPRGSRVFEITRFCLSRRQDARSRRETRDRLVSALTWHALEQGITTYTGVAEIAWLQQILAFGWDCRPLGLPSQSPCGMLAALAIEIDRETPRLLEQNGIWRPVSEPRVRLPEAA